MELPPILTRKIGPLPVVAWAGVGAGAFVVFRLLTGKGGSSTSASPSAGAAPVDDAGDGTLSAGGSDSGTTAPPVVAVPTAPVTPPIGASPDPTTKAGWLARFYSLITPHQAHVFTQGTAAERSALIASLTAAQAHALHMYNTTPASVKPSVPTVNNAAQVPAVKVPSTLASVKGPSAPPVVVSAAARPATASRITLAKFPVTPALKPTVKAASA